MIETSVADRVAVDVAADVDRAAPEPGSFVSEVGNSGDFACDFFGASGETASGILLGAAPNLIVSFGGGRDEDVPGMGPCSFFAAA